MPGINARLAFDARDIVGESAIWLPSEDALYWIDIVGARIHRLEPGNGRHQTWTTPELPTSIGLAQNGQFVVGLRQRICLWRPGGRFETLAIPEPDLAHNRLNEGVVAPDGSFWVGTMRDNIGPDGQPVETNAATGSLYRVTADGAVKRLSDIALGITNTMIWLDDGKFITADTKRNRLMVFDYDADDHQLANPRSFGHALERGLPDGSCRTGSGEEVLNCRVTGGAIARLGSSGNLLDYIELPCFSPTSCTFGGPDMKTLFVTSARFGVAQSHLNTHPTEGGVFAVDMSVKGMPPSTFRA